MILLIELNIILPVFGNPRLIFFHETGISDISQNNFIAFTKLRKVVPVISSLSTFFLLVL
jgi:hypothetical protein